jgi:hypothetical protein
MPERPSALSLIQPITLSLSKLSLLQRMGSNDNDKRKLEDEAEFSMASKRLQLFDDNGGDDDSSDSSSEETENEEEGEEETLEEVSSEGSSMNQLDTSEEKLLAKCGRGIIFSDDGDTTSLSSEPRTPETPSNHVRSDPDSSDDDDNFWM